MELKPAGVFYSSSSVSVSHVYGFRLTCSKEITFLPKVGFASEDDVLGSPEQAVSEEQAPFVANVGGPKCSVSCGDVRLK